MLGHVCMPSTGPLDGSLTLLSDRVRGGDGPGLTDRDVTVALRPDITVAAAKLTSGFDVSRELRQLGALLRAGEIVHRLVAGVYGSGGGLLAVTNRRGPAAARRAGQ